MANKKTYLVTGGAGFIGSHLADRLLKDGHHVVVIDDFSLGKKENLESARSNLEVHKKSVCGDLKPIFKAHRFNAVFHLAALPRVQFSIAQPRESHQANVNGTLNILIAARDAGVKRFVFASSGGSVYGEQKIPFVETMACKPISPYALQKYVGEEYCRLFHLLYGMETVSMRYFNVYGPRQNPEGAYANQISKFFHAYCTGARPTIFGDGTVTRDNTYVSDVVNATIRAGQTLNKKVFGEAFNIGAEKKYSVNQTTRFIMNLTGSRVWPKRGPARIEPHDVLADISKARKMLGWKPKTSYDDGLAKTYEYFKNKRD